MTLSKILLLSASAIFILSSCSSMNQLTINILEPAPVYVPENVKTVGIIDRSGPTDTGAQVADIVDKIFSVEGPSLDKDAAQSAIAGLSGELTRYDKFSGVKFIDKTDLKNPGLSVFPAPLAWDVVSRICQDNNVDALFELSFFDTDTRIDYKIVNSSSKIPFTGIPIPEHHATVETKIKTGWRFYDPQSKTILDEFPAYDGLVSHGSGINPVKAVEAIIGRNEAVKTVSGKIGEKYALRYIPYRVNVLRDYYVKGTPNFEMAKRRAQTGDWQWAAELWAEDVANPDPEIAGRACYNMAISSEINGKLNDAVNWVSKSYVDYNNKKALEYLNILKYRLSRSKKL